MRLQHPRVAAMDCRLCERFVVDGSWNFEFGRDGNLEPRILNCGPEFLAACRDPRRGCPKGSPENSNSLNRDNELCYEHYKECVAVGQFPDDSVVRRNAALIRGIVESIDQSREAEFQSTLLKMMVGR